MTDVTAQHLTALARWDTPTICNGLALVVPERRASGFTVESMVCFDPSLPPIVGFAKTATIRAAAPAPGTPAEIRARRGAYYAHVAAGEGPTISIIQDLDPTPGTGAFWGEVNTTIHQGLGCLGVVTNGSFRDLDACAPGFQILAGKVVPGHAHAHVVDFGGAVSVCGMAVCDGDVIHADRHGAVVVPRAAVGALPEAIERLARREAVVLECARRADFDVDKLERAMAEAAALDR